MTDVDMWKRLERAAVDFFLTDAPPNTSNPLHALTGKRLKPWIGITASAAFLGHAVGTSYLEVKRRESAGPHVGIVPVPRYSTDGQPNVLGGPGPRRDLTLGATGDIVFGLRELSRRY